MAACFHGTVGAIGLMITRQERRVLLDSQFRLRFLETLMGEVESITQEVLNSLLPIRAEIEIMPLYYSKIRKRFAGSC